MNNIREIIVKEGENLNKENFWNILMEIYPNAIEAFCKWIDDYKKIEFNVPHSQKINWQYLFADDEVDDNEDRIKFHHLPIEMQVGIIFRFFHEQKMAYTPTNVFSTSNQIELIVQTFKALEEILTKQ